MSRRCKPGKRARFIKSVNKGKIVLVVRHYFGEPVSNGRWPLPPFPWVVTSLSGPLRFVHLDSGKEAMPAMTMVADDSDLEPLDDDGDRSSDEFDLAIPSANAANGPSGKAPVEIAR